MIAPRQLTRECLAEFIGTLILVFFGVGAVNAAVLAGVTQGLWQVAMIWAVGVALAIYATGAVSGAHLNPAITAALAVWRGFPRRKIPLYVGAQLAGAFCGSLLLYGLFHGLLADFEATHRLVRGGPGSELSAMVFGEYFPNPAMIGATAAAYHKVSLLTAMLAEAIGAAFLAGFVFALTAPRNPVGPRYAVPLFIGLALAVIIMIIAPLTQAGLNPARDFGPRLLAYLLGWGNVAIPGPRGGFFTVYILAPILGAVVGSGVYEWLGRSLSPTPAQQAAPEESAPLARSDEVEVGVYETSTALETMVMKPAEPTVILVPCADSGHVGCEIARRAADLLVTSLEDTAISVACECPRGTRSFIVAIDGSSACQASAALRECGCRPGAVVSAPSVLAQAGLVKPGVDVRARLEECASALASAVRDSLQAVFAEMRERRRYREEMAPIITRFQGIWEKFDILPPPNGAVAPAEATKVELLGRRSRNLFVKFDEVLPPTEWSEAHDLFQDALLCIAYATEGWIAGDTERWEQNLEKARIQVKPLLKRLQS
ncbi:MAG: MIP/aquaporin family protein [Armatimonadota bacterium]